MTDPAAHLAPDPAGAIRRPWPRLLLILAATVVALGLSVLAITPKLLPWRDNPLVYETTKVAPMIKQLTDPGGWDRVHWSDPEFNGIQTIRWRLLPPVFGRLLHLPPPVYLTLPWLGLLWLTALCIHYSMTQGATALQAGALGVLVGTSSATFSASCAVGYFDPFYLIALLVACFTPSRLLFLAACLLGPWVDEKFLLMLPACCILRWTWQPIRQWWAPAVAGIAPYCLFRLVAWALGDTSVTRQFDMQGAVFWDYAPALPAGWWYGFRVGWVLIALGLWQAGRLLDERQRWLLFAALAGAIGSVSFLAWDTTRSIAMLLPALVIGLSFAPFRRYVPWLAAINLLLPAAYVWCARPETVPLKSILVKLLASSG